MSKCLFLDSFDHYTTAQILRKWTQGGGTIVTGRTGNGLRGGPPSKTLNTEHSTFTAGMAYKVESTLQGLIFGFSHITTNFNFYLAHVGDGRLWFRFQLGGGPGDTGPASPSTFVMSLNTWYYVEMQCAIVADSPAHIIASARVNGAEVVAWDYTHGSGAAGMAFNRVSLAGPGFGASGATLTMDDFYLTDDEFLGDVRIGVLYPNAAGDSAAWTPNGAGANWEKVKEHAADDDTTYVSGGSVGLKDLYNLDDIDPAFSGDIKGAQALWLVKKSDEGSGAMKGLWKSGGAEIIQAAGHNFLAPNGFYPSAEDYTYNIQTERESLFTASPWTAAEVNALELGITRTL